MSKIFAANGVFSRLFLITAFIIVVFQHPCFAEVYKHVDEKGNVSYSDVPQKKGDKPISMPEPMTYKPLNTPKSVSEGGGKKPASPKIVQYESVSITSPVNDQAIRSNNGSVTVQISSKPVLQASNVYVLYMDGSKIQESSGGSITLPNVDRGSHTLSVQILNDKGQILASSESVTFYLFRQSIIRH